MASEVDFKEEESRQEQNATPENGTEKRPEVEEDEQKERNQETMSISYVGKESKGDFQKMYTNVIRSIPEPTLMSDSEMNVIYINPAASQLTGYSSDEATSMKCYEVFKQAGDSCRHNCILDAIPEDEQSQSGIERTIRTRDGQEIPTLANIGRLVDDQGNGLGCIETLRDTTDLREIEQQMESALLNVTNEIQKSNTILAGIPDPTFTIDGEKNITFFNQAAEELTGHSKDDALGKKCRKIIGANICRKSCTFEMMKDTDDIVSGIDAEITDGEGGTIAAMCSASTLKDSEGNIIGAIEIFKDMTEMKTLMKEQEESKDYLEDQVNKLLEVVSIAAGGDLTAIATKEKDDAIGELVDGINDMSDNLINLVKEIQNTAGNVTSTSQDLASSAEEMNASTQQVSSAIQQISRGAQSQASQVEESAKVTRDMSSSMEEVAQRAEESVKSGSEAYESVKDGRKGVEETVKKMNEIQKVVVDSAGVIENLGDRSAEISEIVDVITNITDQTNLLALNAAIEAARAGDQGRGFAVVAEEVKNLAEDSREAAKRISKMITEIQNIIGKAVTSMKEGTKEVEEGMQIVNETDATFQMISDSNQKVNTEILAISDASQKQRAGIDHVAKSIDNIASIAEETASASVQSASSTEELTASMEEMTARAQNLSELAVALQMSAGRFRLSEEDDVDDPEMHQYDQEVHEDELSKKRTSRSKRTKTRPGKKSRKKIAKSLKKRGIEIEDVGKETDEQPEM